MVHYCTFARGHEGPLAIDRLNYIGMRSTIHIFCLLILILYMECLWWHYPTTRYHTYSAINHDMLLFSLFVIVLIIVIVNYRIGHLNSEWILKMVFSVQINIFEMHHIHLGLFEFFENTKFRKVLHEIIMKIFGPWVNFSYSLLLPFLFYKYLYLIRNSVLSEIKWRRFLECC